MHLTLSAQSKPGETRVIYGLHYGTGAVMILRNILEIWAPGLRKGWGSLV